MREPTAQTEEKYAGAPAHPEEITASVEFRVGNSVSLNATVRTTPAGLAAAGVMVAAIVLSITVLVRATRWRPG
jgi:hypothetical protein